MLEDASTQSAQICEGCGAASSLQRLAGWVTTLCTSCQARRRGTLGLCACAAEPRHRCAMTTATERQAATRACTSARVNQKDLALGGELRQKPLDFAGTHVTRMPHGPATARAATEEADPVDVHLLGAEAIVHVPDALAQLIQNPARLQHWGAGPLRNFITRHISRILGTKPACKPLSGGVDDQLMEQRPTSRADFALDITLCSKDSHKLKQVVQEETSGRGIASVANIFCKIYFEMKGVANAMGIHAASKSLWSDTQHVRRMLSSAGMEKSIDESPFESWEALPDLALLSIKRHQAEGKYF